MSLNFHLWKINRTETFSLLDRYEAKKYLGSGAYGFVALVKDNASKVGIDVAIKKFKNVYYSKVYLHIHKISIFQSLL